MALSYPAPSIPTTPGATPAPVVVEVLSATGTDAGGWVLLAVVLVLVGVAVFAIGRRRRG